MVVMVHGERILELTLTSPEAGYVGRHTPCAQRDGGSLHVTVMQDL